MCMSFNRKDDGKDCKKKIVEGVLATLTLASFDTAYLEHV